MLFSGVLEARGSDVAKWLQSQAFEAQLFSFFPCSDLPSPVASPIRVSALLLVLRPLGLCQCSPRAVPMQVQTLAGLAWIWQLPSIAASSCQHLRIRVP